MCLPPRQRPQRSQRLPPPGFFASVAVRCCPCSLLDRLRCSVATAQAPPVFDRASGRAGEPAGACSAPIDGGPRPTRHGWQMVRESIRDCRGHREASNCGHHTELVLSSTAVPFRWPRAGATGCGSARAPQGRDSRASSVPAPAELAAAKAGGIGCGPMLGSDQRTCPGLQLCLARETVLGNLHCVDLNSRRRVAGARLMYLVPARRTHDGQHDRQHRRGGARAALLLVRVWECARPTRRRRRRRRCCRRLATALGA